MLNIAWRLCALGSRIEGSLSSSRKNLAGRVLHLSWSAARSSLGLLLASFATMSFAAGQDASTRGTVGASAPMRTAERLIAAEHGVGSLVPDLEVNTIDGRTSRLSELAKSQPVAIVMTSSSCPLSLKYQPTLKALVERFSSQGVTFVAVAPVETDTEEEIRQIATLLGEQAWVVRDTDGSFARQLGALSTTDAFVIDSARTVLFHGAVDDQYGVGVALEQPKNAWLSLALEAILDGQRPMVEATFAPGCLLDTELNREPVATNVSYHQHIARIMQRHCVSCHRNDGVGPFPLDTFDDVVSHAPMIKQVVSQGIMPPWFAAHSGTGVSPWANDRTMADVEKRQLLAWIDSDRPEGNIADAPAPLSFAGSWSIGEPDAIYGFAEPQPIKASGIMPYVNVRVETGLTEDRWVSAIEVMPGVREVVHHVLVFVEDPAAEGAGRGVRRRSENDETGGFWAAYVPGNSTLIYPHGYAKKLPKGAVLRFQMHYTPMGRAVEDRTSIGVKFASEAPEYEVKVHGLANVRISIPPGAERHQEEAQIRLPMDIQLLAFVPHMHLRGAACRYDLVKGTEVESLLDIPRYDFNWQLLYRYAQPVQVNAGQTLRFTAWYDNSEGNPANPDPSKTVRWGAQTFDEMMLGYVEYVELNGSRTAASESGVGAMNTARAQQAVLRRAFEQLDSDRNGRLTREEFEQAGERFPRLERFAERAEQVFSNADADSDGELNSDEFMEAGARLLSRIR